MKQVNTFVNKLGKKRYGTVYRSPNLTQLVLYLLSWYFQPTTIIEEKLSNMIFVPDAALLYIF